MSLEAYGAAQLGFWHSDPTSRAVLMCSPQSGSTSWPVASVQPFNTLPLSKYEPCSSPSLSSTSRSASVSTLGPPSPHSVCSDDPANTTKRARASPTPHPSRVGRSLSPQSSTRLESSQTKQARAKYRSIRPAPANTSEPSSKVPASHMPRLPRQSPPEPSHRSRHPISEPSTPYPRGTPFNFTPHSSWAAEANGPFLHTPTDLPPQRYARGLDSPFRPEKLEGTIPGSMLDMIPALEARVDRLENALAQYAESRVNRALRNSIIEGLEPENS